ncbi:unnamed protein product [Vitrella brassicaformis CCMP3155]|uniref:Uncharacterized protein n=1 Tax=Vitrella brassicaformis (strain CCMP3155) TaxID=1169540 RepID=A0A0G4GST6_VITBC|nr:unnamed protein product [Vitrella brassicaformis CCMP3155]|eukprot:CEM33741.1 unnamed protein product [Vitrella brassicaformis CCMP3155]
MGCSQSRRKDGPQTAISQAATSTVSVDECFPSHLCLSVSEDIPDAIDICAHLTHKPLFTVHGCKHGKMSASRKARWHVKKGRGILTHAKARVAPGGSVEFVDLWEEECKGTKWGQDLPITKEEREAEANEAVLGWTADFSCCIEDVGRSIMAVPSPSTPQKAPVTPHSDISGVTPSSSPPPSPTHPPSSVATVSIVVKGIARLRNGKGQNKTEEEVAGWAIEWVKPKRAFYKLIYRGKPMPVYFRVGEARDIVKRWRCDDVVEVVIRKSRFFGCEKEVILAKPDTCGRSEDCERDGIWKTLVANVLVEYQGQHLVGELVRPSLRRWCVSHSAVAYFLSRKANWDLSSTSRGSASTIATPPGNAMPLMPHPPTPTTVCLSSPLSHRTLALRRGISTQSTVVSSVHHPPHRSLTRTNTMSSATSSGPPAPQNNNEGDAGVPHIDTAATEVRPSDSKGSVHFRAQNSLIPTNSEDEAAKSEPDEHDETHGLMARAPKASSSLLQRRQTGGRALQRRQTGGRELGRAVAPRSNVKEVPGVLTQPASPACRGSSPSSGDGASRPATALLPRAYSMCQSPPPPPRNVILHARGLNLFGRIMEEEEQEHEQEERGDEASSQASPQPSSQPASPEPCGSRPIEPIITRIGSGNIAIGPARHLVLPGIVKRARV